MKYFLSSLFITITASFSFAQTITGTVTEDSGATLPFVNISVLNSDFGTTSDIDGNYELELTAGSFDLEFSYVGFDTQVIHVDLSADQKVDVLLTIGSTSTLNTLTLEAVQNQEKESATLLEQKSATEIKQSIGAEELSRKGVGNAAGAVSKISGISKQEGSSTVFVRGLGDRYLSTTMNGLYLPSNDINKKNIDLGLFSSDVIGKVAVSKTYASAIFSDFAAGNIDVSSKEYKGSGMAKMSYQAGVNTAAVGQDWKVNEGTGWLGDYARYAHNPFAVIVNHAPSIENSRTAPINQSFNLTAGKSYDLGEEGKISLFGSVGLENDFEYREGLVGQYSASRDVFFPYFREMEYSTTSSVLAGIIYKLNANNKLKVNSLFINSSSDEVGLFGEDGQGFEADLADNGGYYQQNLQFNQDRIFVNQLLGDHDLTEKTTLTWGVGYNTVIANEPDRKRFTLGGYDTNSPYFIENTTFDNQRFFSEIDENEWNGRLDFAIKTNETDKLNLGYFGRSKERNFESTRFGIKGVQGKTVNPNDIASFFTLANLEAGEFSYTGLKPAVVEYGVDNAPLNPENLYSGTLNSHAAHINYEWFVTEKLLIVSGLRYEDINQEVYYDVTNLLDQDNQRTVGYQKGFFLPSLNLKYSPNEDSNFRVAMSKTISIPEFKEIAPFVYEDVTFQIGGNPDVIGVSDVYNADIKYEIFPKSGEIISLGAFYKNIQNPINTVIANDAANTVRYFRTGDQARVLGVELEVKKDLWTSADEESVFSGGINLSVMDTHQDLKSINGTFSAQFGDRTEDQLQGASPFIGNLDFSYAGKLANLKSTATVAFNYFSDRIFALGSSGRGNQIEKAVPTLDFVLKSEITEKINIGFSFKNIFNPDIELVQEGTEDGTVSISKFQRGSIINLSLAYKF